MILQDIFELGFVEKKEWFFEETKKINYILNKKEKIFRAIFTEYNGLPFLIWSTFNSECCLKMAHNLTDNLL